MIVVRKKNDYNFIIKKKRLWRIYFKYGLLFKINLKYLLGPSFSYILSI